MTTTELARPAVSRAESKDKTQKATSIIDGVQKRIILGREFVNSDGETVHQSLYLRPGEIIESLRYLSPSAKTTENAARIIKDGWTKIYGEDMRSKEQRRHAMTTLLTLSESWMSRIKIHCRNNELSEKQLRSLEFIEGTRLTAISELDPTKYKKIVEKYSNKKYGKT